MNPMAANVGGSNPMGAPAGPPQGPQAGAHQPPPQGAPMGSQAGQLQQMGRGDDTQLVHMTPAEVNSLHGLANHFGGKLTTNPHTGLPEAGWLGKLLPTLIGVGLNFIPGVGPLLSAGLVAAGSTAVTGDLSKGLTAGLQAFGGASMAGALAPGATAGGSLGSLFGGGAQAAAPGAAAAAGAGAGAAAPALNLAAPISQSALTQSATGAIQGSIPTIASGGAAGMTGGAGFGAGNAGLAQISGGAGNTANGLLSGSPFGASPGAITQAPLAIGNAAPVSAGAQATQAAQAGSKGIFGKFADASRDTMSKGLASGMVGKAAPMLAGAGLLSTVSDVMTPSAKKAEGDDEGSPNPNFKQVSRKSIFDDSYKPGGDLAFGSSGSANIPMPDLTKAPPPVSSRPPIDSRERQYFDVVNPMPGVTPVAETTTPLSSSKSSKSSKKNSKTGFSDTEGWNFAEGGMTGGFGGGGKGGGSGGFQPPAPAPTQGFGGGGKGGRQGGQSQSSASLSSPSAPSWGGVMGGQQGTSANAYGDFLKQQSVPSYDPQGNIAGYSPAAGGLAGLPTPNAPPDYAKQLQAEQMAQENPAANIEMYQQAQQKLADNPGQFQGPSIPPPEVGQLQGQSQALQQALVQQAPRVGLTQNYAPWQPPQLSQSGNMPQAAPASGSSGKGGTQSTARQNAQSAAMGGKGGSRQFARGGKVLHMESGGHVIPAFDVATYGHGSTNAGQAALRKLGGLPIRGKGDGVSDSIPAKIDKTQPARVADGEVYFPPAAVKKLGGNAKLYSMMAAAEKARRATPSGERVRGLA